MERDEHAQQGAGTGEVGAYSVGADIRSREQDEPVGSPIDEIEQADTAPRGQVVGENSGIVGDSDSMTTGNSGNHDRDDTDQRNISRATKSGESADEFQDLNTLRDDPNVDVDKRGA